MMNKLAEKKWKKFSIVEIFNVKNTASILAKDIEPNSGSLPYVTASSLNNGVSDYISFDKNYIDEGNSIFIGGKTLTINWQEKDYVSNDSHNLSLIIKNEKGRTKYAQLFMVTALYKSLKDIYKWSDSISKKSIQKDFVHLPVDENENPDFDFMDSYMKQVEDSVNRQIEDLCVKQTQKKVDIHEWKDFGITSLFDLSLPKGDLQIKKVIDGVVPLITPSNSNNGLFKRISASSESTLYKKGALTVDMFGNAYYHDEDFFVTAHGHVNVLLPKICINKFHGLFIATAIRTMFLNKYGFSEMCTQKALKNEKITLPVDENDNLDYMYMENYMKNVNSKMENKVNTLYKIN